MTVLVAGGFIGLFAMNTEKVGIIAFGDVVLIFWCIGTKFFLTTTKDFPAASLREVRQEQKSWLRLIAAGGETTFGHPDLNEAEVAWFREVILQTIQNPGSGKDGAPSQQRSPS